MGWLFFSKESRASKSGGKMDGAKHGSKYVSHPRMAQLKSRQKPNRKSMAGLEYLCSQLLSIQSDCSSVISQGIAHKSQIGL